MPRMYALVCFDDGDAALFDYDAENENILDIRSEWEERATYKEIGTDKDLLLKKASMARSDAWTNEPWDYTEPDKT